VNGTDETPPGTPSGFAAPIGRGEANGRYRLSMAPYRVGVMSFRSHSHWCTAGGQAVQAGAPVWPLVQPTVLEGWPVSKAS
jgi:hypothetical protein